MATTTEVRIQVGELRVDYWQGNITAANLKLELQNINWSSVSSDADISVELMQDIVNNTITQLDNGTL